MSHTTDHSENPSHESSEPPSEHSESTSRHSKPRTIIEWHDSSEDSNASTHHTPVRSPTHGSPPPAPEQPPQPTRGPRIRVTARKRVPIPMRVTFPVPPRDEGESSRPRARDVSPPPPATGVPVPPTGMTTLESHWVAGLASQVEGCRSTIGLHNQSIDGLLGILNNHSRSMDMMVDTLVTIRRNVRTLRTFLALVMVILVVMIGLVVQIMLRQ